MKSKSHMNWSWILMVLFFVFSIIDVRFSILGFLCMGFPLYHALKGRGKIHCIKYCPRGSFLAKFISAISLNNNLPKGMNTKTFKNILLSIMLTVFAISLYRAGLDLVKISLSIFKFMTVSSIIAFIMGVIYKPRSWCVVCPMGHATGMIRDAQNNMNKKRLKEIEC